ncbi:MAG: hypothetical protein VXW60_02765, partial [Bacteroidota bacterium]|nr:hypothetical protein [Bacteroidota bacterium]
MMPNTKMHGERQSKPLENDHQKVCEALARIVELGSKCGAACIVGDKIYVSNNNIHSTSKENNKARQKIITIMTFLGLQEKSQVQSGSTADTASGAAKAAIASSSSSQATKSKESDGGKEQEDADSSEEEFPPYEDDADAIKTSTEQQRSLVKEFLADKQHYKDTEAYKKTYPGDKK